MGPAGTRDKLEPYDLKAGRIKLTLLHVRRTEATIERRYPTHTAPNAVADRYNALLLREHRLVVAFNTEVDVHNAVIDSSCTRN